VKRVLIWVLDGCLGSSIAGPMDVFMAANMLSAAAGSGKG